MREEIMANMCYNELQDAQGNTAYASDLLNKMDPLYKYDTHFPERITKLNIHSDKVNSPRPRRGRNRANRNSARFRTQPVTFDEIKEVDEEKPEEETKENIRTRFTEFSKSLGELIPGKDQTNAEEKCEKEKPSAKERLKAPVLTDKNQNSQPSRSYGLPAGLPMEYDHRRKKKMARKKLLLEEQPEPDSPTQERAKSPRDRGRPT